MKYSDYLAQQLAYLGYTKCFTLGGGNIMHLVESFSKHLEMVPVVHEVSAAIAAEHFNLISQSEKAVVLVTTGPGITNCVTAIASCFVESRELLVIGGQVKTADLSMGMTRQIGIQEIDGVKLLEPITKVAKRLDKPIVGAELNGLIEKTWQGRKGPVFLEIPLDVQAQEVGSHIAKASGPQLFEPGNSELEQLKQYISVSRRPVLLIGSGLDRDVFQSMLGRLIEAQIPLMTTWNAADYLDNRLRAFFGRPNYWGQRFSNILLQQADLVIALGARLGLQQTGFNWESFVPQGEVVQVDIDEAELRKKPGLVDLAINADANLVLIRLVELLEAQEKRWSDWIHFGSEVKAALPVSEHTNSRYKGYWNPYEFYLDLSRELQDSDVLLPCSSGSSFTSAYQAVELNGRTRMFSSKSLASMGYGLGAAIGVAKSKGTRPILVEGDGGFAQNFQDVGTLYRANRDSKVFIWANDGYASIRKTQQSYFGGNYVGCDESTGLVLPDFEKVFSAYGLTSQVLSSNASLKDALSSSIDCFIVPINPEQTYYPKITSRVKVDGGMESSPLHLMTPELDPAISERVFRYI